MTRRGLQSMPETRSQWQIGQASKCSCRGSDDYCPCQNESPNDRQARSPASRKSAERQRRKDAGEVRIECWVSERDGARLKEMARDADISIGHVVTQLLAYYYS